MKILHVLALTFCLVVLVNAQGGVLTGTIYDESGTVIGEARLIAVNERSGERFETLTNKEGAFSLILPFDKYEITILHHDYNSFSLKNFIFVNSSKGQMVFDIALRSRELCGVAGCGDYSEKIETEQTNILTLILEKPLEKLPKEINIKRKNNK